MIRKLIARLKDKFLPKVKIPTFIYAPAVCPRCGAQIEVPLSRSTMRVVCHLCQHVIHTMAIGIVDADERRLKYVYDEVCFWIRANSEEYSEMSSKQENRSIQ
jgi:ribosomal protein S27E